MYIYIYREREREIHIWEAQGEPPLAALLAGADGGPVGDLAGKYNNY